VIRCAASASFADWLRAAGGSLAITTYQAGKVALVGLNDGQVTVLFRQFDKPLGLAVRGGGGGGGEVALATRHEVTLFADAPLLAPDFLEAQPGRYDALYLPRASYFTGDLNAHDLQFAADDELWVVNTRFSCLSSLSRRHSFLPRWRPPFVTDTVPEDRCHLNGLAVVDGRPKYVTCLGTTDTPGGWRPRKAVGGVVVDVGQNEVVLRGLSMPHSPRWYKEQLWVLNSGAGELWAVNPKTFEHAVVCALPGYLRGLCFVGPYALVGLCQIRERHIFGGLPVQDRWPQLLCGVAVIDLRSGRQVAMLEFTGGCEELYEVQFLPGVSRPMILNREGEAARQAFAAPQFSYWLRPGNEIPVPPIDPLAT
jgi:uncharacterized protein (TIGR03032 family)